MKDKRRLAVIEAEELEPQAYTLVPWEKVLAYAFGYRTRFACASTTWFLPAPSGKWLFYGFEQDRMRENSDCGAAWGQAAAGRAEGGEGSPAEPGERAFAQCGDAAGESGAAAAPAAGAPAGNPEKAPAGLLSMMATDRFDRLYREKLAYIIAVLNHNARIGNCNALLDLACALGGELTCPPRMRADAGRQGTGWNACGGMPKGGACLHAGPLYAGPSGGRAAQGSGDVFANGRALRLRARGLPGRRGPSWAHWPTWRFCRRSRRGDGSVAQLTALYEQLSGERA